MQAGKCKLHLRLDSGGTQHLAVAGLLDPPSTQSSSAVLPMPHSPRTTRTRLRPTRTSSTRSVEGTRFCVPPDQPDGSHRRVRTPVRIGRSYTACQSLRLANGGLEGRPRVPILQQHSPLWRIPSCSRAVARDAADPRSRDRTQGCPRARRGAREAPRGGVVVVEGPPGIGKTRLLQEFTARADKGVRPLFGQAFEYQQTVPFAPLFMATLRADPPIGQASTLRRVHPPTCATWW